MTLEQLRIFVAVAEREHVTRAAGDLNLTQSAVSAAVSTLEARYAVKLFNRVGRRIELTEAGHEFLIEARGVLARAAAAESMLADLAGLKRGTLSIAGSQTVANYWLPPLLQRYARAFPGISLKLAIGNTERVAEMVHEGAADVGFIEAEVDHPALSVTPVAEDEIVLVVSTGLERDAGDKLTAAKLKALPWVLREPGSGTRAVFESALAKLGLKVSDLDIKLQLPSNEAVRAAVEDGAGATVLSRLVVAEGLKSGMLRELPLALPKRSFFALKHKERVSSKAESELYKLIREDA